MSGTQSQESVINSTTSPGELLFRQREQLGVPLADAARALNLRPAVVAGLEQDNYQEIPVAAYRRGYLRAYAKYLGMDDRLVLEAYQARNGDIDTERKVTSVSTVRPPSRLGAWLFKLVTLLVIVGLIAVTVMWWQSRGGNEPPGFDSSSTNETANAPTQSPSAPTETAETAETTGESTASSSSFTTSGENAGLSSDAARITPTPTAPQSPTSDDAGDSAAAVEPSSQTDTSSEAQAATAAENDEAENDEAESDVVESDVVESEPPSIADAESTASGNTLELTFNEQSWTEIFDATNQRVFVGLQSPGTSTTVEGEPPFRLTVGNATGVELRYQGEEVDLPARAGANNVARFTLGE